MQRFKKGTVFFYKVYDIFFGYRNSVDADSFTEIYQMWRSVKSCLVSG